MCMDCHKAWLKLGKKGYSREFREMFFWSFTAYPVGDNALKMVNRFLSVPRRRRNAWLNKISRRWDASMDRTPATMPPTVLPEPATSEMETFEL